VNSIELDIIHSQQKMRSLLKSTACIGKELQKNSTEALTFWFHEEKLVYQ